MDLSVLHKLTYGMYAVGTLDGIRPAGCIVNTVIQVTSDNPVIAVSMNKNNFTYEAIKKSGRFSISILSASPGYFPAANLITVHDKSFLSVPHALLYPAR